MFSHPSFLRRVLIADAVSSAGMGLALLLVAGYVDELLGLPAAFLESAGLALLPFAAFVLYIATRPSLARAAVWAVVVLNAIWVVDSLLVFVTGLAGADRAGRRLHHRAGDLRRRAGRA